MPKFSELVSSVIIQKENPHEETRAILHACMPPLVRQQNWHIRTKNRGTATENHKPMEV